jgi:hypothetical protein
LNQADRCECEQGYNRFSHYAFPSLYELPLKTYNTFAAGLFERSKSACSKLTVSIGNLIVHHPERTQTKAGSRVRIPSQRKTPADVLFPDSEFGRMPVVRMRGDSMVPPSSKPRIPRTARCGISKAAGVACAAASTPRRTYSKPSLKEAPISPISAADDAGIGGHYVAASS